MKQGHFAGCRNAAVLAALFADFSAEQKLQAVHALLCDVTDAVCGMPAADAAQGRQLNKAVAESFDATDAVIALRKRLAKANKAAIAPVTPMTYRLVGSRRTK